MKLKFHFKRAKVIHLDINEEGNYKTTAELARKTAKSASFLVSGKVVSMLIQVFMFVVVARLLLPKGYGIYTLALSTAGFASAVGSLNIGTYLNERIPFLIAKKKTHQIKNALGDAAIAIVLPGVALSLIGIALSVPIAEYVLHSVALYPVIIIAMATIAFSFIYNSFNLILVGFHDGKSSGIGMILYSVVQAVFSILLVYLAGTLQGKIEGAIAGYIIALFAASLFQIFASSKPYGISFEIKGMRKRIGEMLRFSMPLTYSNIIGTIVTNFSVIFLGIFVLPSFVGYYGVASRIGTLIDVVAGTMATVLIPMFAEAINSKGISGKIDRFFYYSVYFGLLFTTPMVLYVTVFAHALMNTLFSSYYNGSTFYMQLVGIGMLIGILGSFATQLVISTRETKVVFKYSLYVGIVEFLALLVLVPIFHVVGLIAAMLYVGGLATDILFMRYLKKKGIRISFGKDLRILLANIILGIFLALLFLVGNPEIMLAAGILVILVAYPPILVKIGAVADEEMKLLRKIGGGVPLVGRILNMMIGYAEIFL